MDKNTLIELIDSCFLDAGQKQELRRRLDAGQPADAVAADMDARLTAELERRQKDYVRKINGIDAEFQGYAEEYRLARQTLEAKLETALAALPPEDADGRGRLWAGYDLAVDKLQSEYRKKTEGNVSASLLSAAP